MLFFIGAPVLKVLRVDLILEHLRSHRARCATGVRSYTGARIRAPNALDARDVRERVARTCLTEGSRRVCRTRYLAIVRTILPTRSSDRDESYRPGIRRDFDKPVVHVCPIPQPRISRMVPCSKRGINHARGNCALPHNARMYVTVRNRRARHSSLWKGLG